MSSEVPGYNSRNIMNKTENRVRKLFVVYNPHAAFGRAIKMLTRIENSFKKKEIEVEIKLTEFPKHAIEIVRSLDFSVYDGLVVAGGDGSMFEALNGYFQNTSAKRIPLGMIPIGTGNAFVRDLNLRTNEYEEAITIIARNNPQLTDVGEVKTKNDRFYFINVLGMGFITDVQEVGLKMKILGNISYTLGVLYQIIFLKKYNIKLELDGKIIEGKNIFIEISNTRYTSNFLMAPNASFDDGYLDITILNPMSRMRMLSYFPSIFSGNHIYKKGIDIFKAKNIRVSTENPKMLAPDGELTGTSPFEVNCLFRAVPVFR
jgi:diacylglycerol kinase (ATP)